MNERDIHNSPLHMNSADGCQCSCAVCWSVERGRCICPECRCQK